MFEKTPLQNISADDLDPEFRAEYLSDIMRQVILYKLGGFYMDLDFVVLQNLARLKNFYALTSMEISLDDLQSQGKTQRCDLEDVDKKSHVNNAIMHMDKGHVLTWKIM